MTVPLPAPDASPRARRHAAALELLRSLSGPAGIHASASTTANYRAVFARDAVMAGVAGLLVGDDAIVAGLVRTLESLRALQGPEGQIASNYEMHGDDAPPTVSFGTLAPRIDGATWYLAGVGLAARAGAVDPAAYRDSVRAVVRLLDALEYNGRHLVYVPAGGNWADEWIYDGYVLYDQVLRAWALDMLGATFDEPAWTRKAERISSTVAERYVVPDAPAPHHPLSSFSPIAARDTFDLAACSLLAVSGVAASLSAPALDWIAEHYLRRDALPPAFAPVIEEGDADWPALRRYHLHGFRNRPHEYHNGGIWPVWLGWLALGLARDGRDGELALLRATFDARLDALPAFAFEEYLHGVTGAPRGTARMAYTATGILFLDAADGNAARRLLGR